MMEVAIPPSLVAAIHGQLAARNVVEVHAFSSITASYGACAREVVELRKRCGQLTKEAGELTAQNAELDDRLKAASAAAANSEQVRALEDKTREQQEELTKAYRELHATTTQLGILRQLSETQGKQLGDAAREARELRLRLHELTGQVDKARAEHATAAEELEANLAAREAAAARVAELERENADLIKRLVDLKETEAERLNEVTRMCDDMVRDARQKAAAAAMQMAVATDRRRSSRGSDTLEHLTIAHTTPVAKVPTAALKSVPAHDGGCFALAFDRVGHQLASGGGDRSVRLWDPATGAQTQALQGMLETVMDLSFTCDGKHLAAAGADGKLRLWALDSGRVRHTLTGHQSKVTSVACSPVENVRAVSASTDRTMKVWDLAKGYVSSSILHASICNSARWAADGALLASGHYDGTLRFWDVRSGKLAHEWTGLHTQQICSVTVGTHGGGVLTLGKDNVLKLVDPRTFEMRKMFRAPGFTIGTVWASACLSPDEKHAAAGSADGTVFIWDVDKGTVARTLSGGGGGGLGREALAVVWGPAGGGPLVSGDKAGVVTFWQS